jgi:hypothetical protein
LLIFPVVEKSRTPRIGFSAFMPTQFATAFLVPSLIADTSRLFFERGAVLFEYFHYFRYFWSVLRVSPTLVDHVQNLAIS